MIRIVFVGHGDAGVLGRLPGKPKPLGKGKTGVWLELADDALLAAWGLGAKLDVVYLSKADYAHAVRKLDEKETAKAVEERHAQFSPSAIDQAVGWLGTRARRALALAAAKAPAHVERCLAQLVILETEGRFAMLTPREKVFSLAEAEAGLVAELDDLRPDLAPEIAGHKQFYVELAKELEGLGQKGLVDAPLYVGLTRVYAVSPAGASQRYFRDREQPQTTWQKQPVGPVPHKDAARWRDSGKKLTLLLPSAASIYGVLELTEAQRDVELDERAKDPRLDDYLAQLRVELAVRRRAMAGQVPAGPAALLRRQIPKEGALLGTALKEKPVLGAGEGPPLPEEDKERAADAKFLAAWARLAGRAELALELLAHATLVERDAKDLLTMAEYHCHHHKDLDGKAAFSAVDLKIPAFGGGTEAKKFQSLKNDFDELRKMGGDKGIVDTSVTSAGDSAEGRALWAIKLGHGDKHKVMVNGCHHAREWISVEMPYLLAKYLIENYEKDPTDPKKKRIKHLLENRQLLIIPMTNPDGHMVTITSDRSWRTNRAVHALDAKELDAPRLDGGKPRKIKIVKGSYTGVDVNRNYPEPNWGKETFDGDGNAATSRDPTEAEVYCGEAEASELETQIMRKLQDSEKFRAFISFHAMGQLLLFPDSDDTLKDKFFQFVGKGMSALIDEHGNPYTYGQPKKILYPVTGSAMDYAWHVCPGRPAFSPELRPTEKDRATKGQSKLPASEIEPNFKEMLGAMLGLVNCAGFDAVAGKTKKIKVSSADAVAQVVQNGLAPFKGWTP